MGEWVGSLPKARGTGRLPVAQANKSLGAAWRANAAHRAEMEEEAQSTAVAPYVMDAAEAASLVVRERCCHICSCTIAIEGNSFRSHDMAVLWSHGLAVLPMIQIRS